MIKRMSFTSLTFIAIVAIISINAMLATIWAPSASACGGFFCTNVPVDQDAERIIFTQNRDGTVSAYVQIEYTGAAPDFSWILPLPEAIPADGVPRQLYLPVGVNQFCRFTSLAWPRCWAALVR